MKDGYYFQHDYNARSDKKLVKLSMKYPECKGVGIYWCIVEMLYEEKGYLLRSEYERIAFELRTTNETIKDVIECFELFAFNDDKFWSESVLSRLKLREIKSNKAKESISKRWEKYERNTNVEQTINESNTNKEKKSKIKKSKIKEFIAPSLDDVKAYFKENDYKEETAIKFYQSYSVANWVDSKGNQVKNWKQKAVNVWFNEENKIKKSIDFGVPR